MTVQNVNISLLVRLEWSLSSTADPCYSKFTIICKLALFVSHHFTFLIILSCFLINTWVPSCYLYYCDCFSHYVADVVYSHHLTDCSPSQVWAAWKSHYKLKTRSLEGHSWSRTQDPRGSHFKRELQAENSSGFSTLKITFFGGYFEPSLSWKITPDIMTLAGSWPEQCRVCCSEITKARVSGI